jgi:hypothetical protein
MRLDKHDIFPLSIILTLAIAIPIALWVGLGRRQQIVRDLYDIAKYFAFVGICVAPFIAWLAVRAPNRLFERLGRMTATGRMPRLQKGTDRATYLQTLAASTGCSLACRSNMQNFCRLARAKSECQGSAANPVSSYRQAA